MSTISLYLFNETTGDYSNDIVSQLTLSGNTSITDGYFYKARDFNGSQYMQITGDTLLLNSPTGQIEVYYQPSNITSDETILWQEETITLEVISGTVKFSLYNGSTYESVSTTGQIKPNEINNLICQYINNNSLKIFIDGVLDNQITMTGSISFSNNSYFIGVKDIATVKSNYLNGILSYLKLSNSIENANKIYHRIYDYTSNHT